MKKLITVFLLILTQHSFAQFSRCSTGANSSSLVQFYSFDDSNVSIEILPYQNMDLSIEVSNALAKVDLIKPFMQIRNFQMSFSKCEKKSFFEFTCSNPGGLYVGIDTRYRDADGVFHHYFSDYTPYIEARLTKEFDHYKLRLDIEHKGKFATLEIPLSCN